MLKLSCESEKEGLAIIGTRENKKPNFFQWNSIGKWYDNPVYKNKTLPVILDLFMILVFTYLACASACMKMNSHLRLNIFCKRAKFSAS